MSWMTGRIPIESITPELACGEYPAKAVVGELVPDRRGRPTGRATTPSGCERGVARPRRAGPPVHPDGPDPGRPRPLARPLIRPDAVGMWTLHRRDVRRPVPDLAPRASMKKMDAGQGAKELANDLAIGADVLDRAPSWCRPTGPREVEAAAAACATRRSPLAERTLPALDLADLLWQHPVRELVTGGDAAPDLGGPPAGAVLGLVRVLPPVRGRGGGPARPPGPARHVHDRRAAAAGVAADGLRRGLPAADPPDRPGQPQGPQQRPGGPPGGRRLAVGHRLGRGRPRRDPSAARHARPTSGAFVEQAVGAGPGGGAGPGAAVRPRPSVGHRRIRSGSPRCPTARSRTPRTRRRSTRTSTRSTSTTTPRASGPRSCGWCCTGSGRASRSSGSTTRTPSRSTSGTG